VSFFVYTHLIGALSEFQYNLLKLLITNIHSLIFKNWASKYTLLILTRFPSTGEELLHEGWSSYGNFTQSHETLHKCWSAMELCTCGLIQFCQSYCPWFSNNLQLILVSCIAQKYFLSELHYWYCSTYCKDFASNGTDTELLLQNVPTTGIWTGTALLSDPKCVGPQSAVLLYS
jgi:hypothetical protein